MWLRWRTVSALISAPVPEPAADHRAPEEEVAFLTQAPAVELDGMDEFGNARAWISFDAGRGKFVCKTMETEYDGFTGIILESRVVRVMKEEGGKVFCASSDRQTADVGRPGRDCAICDDQGVSCFPHWWIAWQDESGEKLFAHTLSRTGSYNFDRYARALLTEGLLPSQVVTNIYVEQAHRTRTGTAYRRVQFKRNGDA